jgi:acetolactate synthase-1/2/3 large subunit
VTTEAKLHVYDVLARAFIQENVSTCFALLGDANMNWAARLAQQGCRMVYVRHEHCAVAAAMAYARKTGEVGVATVTCGPGVTQVITALPAAVRAHLPLVVFAGESPLRMGWYNQELNQAPIITATGAAYHPLHLPERMPVAIRSSRLAASGARWCSAFRSICRNGPGPDRKRCRRLRSNCCRASRRCRRIRMTWRAPRNWLRPPSASS